MIYSVEYKPRAVRELENLPRETARRIIEKIEAMAHNLTGDVKKLTGHTAEYRLRVGRYRVLFELEGSTITIYRVRHRREVYDR